MSATIMLGDGTRLFEHPGGATVRLEQLSVTHTKQVTNLWYRIVGLDGANPAYS